MHNRNNDIYTQYVIYQYLHQEEQKTHYYLTSKKNHIDMITAAGENGDIVQALNAYNNAMVSGNIDEETDIALMKAAAKNGNTFLIEKAFQNSLRVYAGDEIKLKRVFDSHLEALRILRDSLQTKKIVFLNLAEKKCQGKKINFQSESTSCLSKINIWAAEKKNGVCPLILSIPEDTKDNENTRQRSLSPK